MNVYCRFCAQKCLNLDNIFNEIQLNDEMSTNPSIMVQETFIGIKFTPKDELSNGICKNCLNTLKISYEFYKNLQKSQFILTEMLAQRKQLNNNRSLRILLPKESSVSTISLKIQNNNPKRIYKCFECPEIFNSRRKLTGHIEKLHTNENICKFCHCSYHDKNQMSNHITNNHSNLKYFCRLCNQNFSTQRTFFKHFKDVHNFPKAIFYCTQCDFIEFSSRDCLIQHLNEIHNEINNHDEIIQTTQDELVMDVEFLDDFFLNQDENSFQFNDCWEALGLNFEDELKLKFCDLSNDSFAIANNNNNNNSNNNINYNAINKKLINRYKCPRCNHEFQSQIKMFLHLAHVHSEKVLACNECGLKFNKITEFNQHNSMHFKENFICTNVDETNEPIYRNIKEKTFFQCKKCKKKYLNKNNYLLHVCNKSLIKNRTLVQCNLCMLNFSNLNEMYAHQKIEHLSKLLPCSLCDKNFKTLSGLKYHLKTHENIKSLNCPYCDRLFLTNINLNAHIKAVHSIKKSHLCTLCDQRFSTLDHLKKHVMSVHQKERNHLCSICGSCFSQVSHLKQHAEIHKAKRKLQCDFCSIGFTRRIDLRKHFEKEHA